MARSFKEFLVESSGLDSGIGSSSYGEYDSCLNEEFKTDEQAITQLQVREYELMRKMSPISEKIRELEKKRSSLMYRIAGMATNLMDAHVTGEKYPQVEKGYEEAKKELEKIDKELDSLYAKIDPYRNELGKIRSAVDKLVIRNAKKAGLHPYDYVSKYDLHSRSIRRRMNEDVNINEEFKTDEQARELEIRKKIQPLQEKLQKLQNKSSSLQKRISKILVDTLNGEISGKEYSVTKQFEEYRKELEKTDKEIESIFDKINSYYSEIQKIKSAVKIRRRMDEDININEEFRTDPEAVKQLQAKQDALYDKLAPYYKRIKELESRRDSLMFRMAGIATNLMEFSEKGEKHPEMEATFKKMGKEEDEINKELEKLYPKHDELSVQIQRNQKVISKIIVRNAKKAGIDILQYVSQNDLFHKPR